MNQFCECEHDGWCNRYQRHMGGRFREICGAVNTDVGTAAVFRELWAREAGVKAVQIAEPPVPLLLKTNQAPGDAVAMTAAIHSLHRAHPGRYITAVHSLWDEVFEHNPDVVSAVGTLASKWHELWMHYPAIHQSNHRAIHFMQGWCEFLSAALGIHVPLLTNRPQLYFSDETPPVEDYWVVCSGGKQDFTNKLWPGYQEVVNILKGKIRFMQVGASKDNHPELAGAMTFMRGKTTLRQLFDIVRRSRGVLCGVSLLMHVAAALEKPCVVIAGGREPVAWNAYPLQQYTHTVGALSCSDTQGHVGGACWRSRVLPLGDGTMLDKNTCERPVDGIPECMRMITPEHVAKLISTTVACPRR